MCIVDKCVNSVIKVFSMGVIDRKAFMSMLSRLYTHQRAFLRTCPDAEIGIYIICDDSGVYIVTIIFLTTQGV